MTVRDYLIGLVVAIVIGVYATYMFAPDFFHEWVGRMLFSN